MLNVNYSLISSCCYLSLSAANTTHYNYCKILQLNVSIVPLYKLAGRILFFILIKLLCMTSYFIIITKQPILCGQCNENINSDKLAGAEGIDKFVFICSLRIKLRPRISYSCCVSVTRIFQLARPLTQPCWTTAEDIKLKAPCYGQPTTSKTSLHLCDKW